jgi:hypothetical protein
MDQLTVIRNGDDFETHYPEELADQLRWLDRHLGLGRRRLLRLMGVRRKELAELEGRDLAEVVAKYEPYAHRVEQWLTWYLARFDYNLEEAARHAERIGAKLRSGEITLEGSIPDYRTDDPLEEREEALIASIRHRGIDMLILGALLSQPPATE